ncbi:MAG: branched-chain amino acid transporter permease, partial [Actinobacteria bacterium]|nr:branched-chain amino acid transporter permease [Actinomycetota bacterium]
MILEQLAGNLFQGVVLGTVYGMATMGLSLIFGVLKVVNVGHGAFIMVGAFTSFAVFEYLGLSPVFAIPVAFGIGMALGMIFYYSSIRRLLKGPELASLLATFSFGVILEEGIKFLFTSDFRGFNWDLGKIDMGFTVLPYAKVAACLGSVTIAVLLYLWFNKTRAGMAMRSVVEDGVGARV